MKKVTQAIAALSVGVACAMPVLAQDTSSSTTASSSPQTTSAPDTTTMGAGPGDAGMTREADNDRDLGWIGLLGLAGLLGLRRRHHHDDHHRANMHPTR